MGSRGRVNGRHFALMRAVLKGECRSLASDEGQDLLRWDYATLDGVTPAPTEEGAKWFRTLQNMEDLSQ